MAEFNPADWEKNKENILPLRQGRDIHAMMAALSDNAEIAQNKKRK